MAKSSESMEKTVAADSTNQGSLMNRLEKRLKEAVPSSSGSDALSFRIEIVQKPLDEESAQNLMHRYRNHDNLKTVGYQQLVLVSDCQTESLVLALSVFLYETCAVDSPDDIRLRTYYLAKLDTTGQFEPRKLQRTFIQAIVKGLLDSWMEVGNETGTDIRIHILSTANPEYMFPLSSKAPEKHCLNGKRLAYWWYRLLDQWKTSSSKFVTAAYWLMPNVDRFTLPSELRESKGWTWGYPQPEAPEEKEKVQEEDGVQKDKVLDEEEVQEKDGEPTDGETIFIPHDSAKLCVPRFPDDAVSAVLERTVVDATIKIQGFLMLLELAPEFHNGDVGIFVLERTSDSTKKPKSWTSLLQPSKNEKQHVAIKTQTKLFDTIQCRLNMIDGIEKVLTFENKEKCRESSKALWSFLSENRSLLCSHQSTVKLYWSPLENSVKKPAKVTAPQINMLTVKRRKTTN